MERSFTVGELKKLLKDFDDDLPLRVFDTGKGDPANYRWFNIRDVKYARNTSISNSALEIETGSDIFW